jgi:hypothetical protein
MSFIIPNEKNNIKKSKQRAKKFSKRRLLLSVLIAHFLQKYPEHNHQLLL